MHVESKRLGDPFPDLAVTISGRSIHAPLVERILELPMDIYAGLLLLFSLRRPLCMLYMRQGVLNG